MIKTAFAKIIGDLRVAKPNRQSSEFYLRISPPTFDITVLSCSTLSLVYVHHAFLATLSPSPFNQFLHVGVLERLTLSPLLLIFIVFLEELTSRCSPIIICVSVASNWSFIVSYPSRWPPQSSQMLKAET